MIHNALPVPQEHDFQSILKLAGARTCCMNAARRHHCTAPTIVPRGHSNCKLREGVVQNQMVW